MLCDTRNASRVGTNIATGCTLRPPVQLSGEVAPSVGATQPRRHGVHAGRGTVWLPPPLQVPTGHRLQSRPPVPGAHTGWKRFREGMCFEKSYILSEPTPVV